jgi:hypothetical protein
VGDVDVKWGLLIEESKWSVDLVVISDTYLGTYDCHANELYEYL